MAALPIAGGAASQGPMDRRPVEWQAATRTVRFDGKEANRLISSQEEHDEQHGLPRSGAIDMPWRAGQQMVFVLWQFGGPALAGGLAFDAVSFVSASAWCLLAATLIDTANVTR